MPVSRRTFLQWATAATTMASSRSLFAGTAPPAIRAGLLPSERAVWDQQVWMAKLGPKYTGNKAHTEFVEFLAREMTATGLEVQRERYTLPRWDARRTEIAVTPARGTRFTVPVTSYFPYSGQTPAAGVTGELAFAGTNPKFDLNNLKGKIALVECPTNVRKWGDEYRPWGIYPATETFPSSYRPARASVNDLTQFQKAGAVAVILIWTDISDANAKDQYSPFSRPPQGIPGLYVGRETGARLRGLIGDAAVTLVLEADVTPDTPTDTLIATLPGASADEVIIINTHTDGPNATEEN